MATGWGYYRIYDAVRSNLQAEATYFAAHRRLVIMTLGEEHNDEMSVVEFPYPGLVVEDPTTPEAISKLLKERFKTEYVTFHQFNKGDWV